MQGGFAFAVEEEDDIFAEGFVGRAVHRKNFDHLVCELGNWGGSLGGRGVVSGNHVLFVQDKLNEGLAQSSWFSGACYQDSNNWIVIWIIHVV